MDTQPGGDYAARAAAEALVKAKNIEENRREVERVRETVESFMENPKAQEFFSGDWRPDPGSLGDRAQLRALFRPVSGDLGAREELGQEILRSNDVAVRNSHSFLRREMRALASDEPLFEKGAIVRAPVEEVPDAFFAEKSPGSDDAAGSWQVTGTDSGGKVSLQKVIEFGNTGQVEPIGEPITVSEFAVASSNDTKYLPN